MIIKVMPVGLFPSSSGWFLITDSRRTAAFIPTDG